MPEDPQSGEFSVSMEPVPGGAPPAFAGMNSEMIFGLTAKHGPEGSRYTGKYAESGQDSSGGLGSPPVTGGREVSGTAVLLSTSE